MTRQELAAEVWGSDTFVDYERGLNFAISQIRTALEDDADHPQFIETLPRRGYRFIAPLREPAVRCEEAEPAVVPAINLASKPVIAPPPEPRIGRKRTASLVLLCLAIFAAAAALAIGFNWNRIRDMSWENAGSRSIKSLAILPLHNLSNNPDQDYFSDGMTDELITELAKLGDVRVISHTSVEQYKGTQRRVPEIARELGVDAVIEGTVTQSGNRVRITAQLIDARTDTHLWAESYERDAADLLELQDEVAREISGQIRMKVRPEEQSRVAGARKTTPQAYDAYLRGRYLWNQRNQLGKDGTAKAMGYFQQAVQEDPNFAAAYAGLADCYWVGWGAPTDYALAERYARKATSLQPDLAEGHASLGIILFNNHRIAEAEKALQRAIELNPNYATAHHFYSVYLMSAGLLSDALAENDRARQLDPFSVAVNTLRTTMLTDSGKYDEAVAQAGRLNEISPQSDLPFILLGRIYRLQGKIPESIEAETQVGIQKHSSKWVRDQQIIAAVYRNEGVSAAQLMTAQVMETDDGPMRTAYQYGVLKNADKALQNLDRADRGHEDQMVLLDVKNAPEFTFLRGDPRYLDLLRRLGLQP